MLTVGVILGFFVGALLMGFAADVIQTPRSQLVKRLGEVELKRQRQIDAIHDLVDDAMLRHARRVPPLPSTAVTTLRNWLVMLLAFSIAIRLCALLITAVIPLLASLAVITFLATLFVNGVAGRREQKY